MGLPVYRYEEENLEQSGERPIARASFFRLRREPAFERALDCFGVPVTIATWEGIYRWFFEAARHRGRIPKVLSFVDAELLRLAWANPALRSKLARADVLLNEGLGLDLYGRLAAAPFADDFDARRLLPKLFACASASTPLRVFLYGGAQGRAAKAARELERRFPGVHVVGAMDGSSHPSAIEIINESCPDILLVGMPEPMQTQWIDENRSMLDVGLVAGVGTFVDVASGEVRRAPRPSFFRSIVRAVSFIARTALYVGFGIGPRLSRSAA